MHAPLAERLIGPSASSYRGAHIPPSPLSSTCTGSTQCSAGRWGNPTFPLVRAHGWLADPPNADRIARIPTHFHASPLRKLRPLTAITYLSCQWAFSVSKTPAGVSPRTGRSQTNRHRDRPGTEQFSSFTCAAPQAQQKNFLKTDSYSLTSQDLQFRPLGIWAALPAGSRGLTFHPLACCLAHPESGFTRRKNKSAPPSRFKTKQLLI